MILIIFIYIIIEVIIGVIGVVPIIVSSMQLYKLHYILLYLVGLFFQSYSIKSYIQTE